MDYNELVESVASSLLEGNYFWADASKNIASQMNVDPSEIQLVGDTQHNYEVFHAPKGKSSVRIGKGKGLQNTIQDTLLSIKMRSGAKQTKQAVPTQGELFKV
jgi:hypothetical protein